MALTPGLQDTFKVHAEESAKLHAFRQNLLEAGLKSGSVDDSVIKTGAAVTKDVQGSLAEQAEKQAKQRADDILFLSIMSDLDNAIRDAERDLNSIEDELIAKYGENWAEIIYTAQFGEEGEGLTKEEKLDRLAEIYLDEKGNPLPEYVDLPIARYLATEHKIDRMKEYRRNNDADGALIMLAEESGSESEAVAKAAYYEFSDNREVRAAAFAKSQELDDAAFEESVDLSAKMPFTMAVEGEQPQEEPEQVATVTNDAGFSMPFGNNT